MSPTLTHSILSPQIRKPFELVGLSLRGIDVGQSGRGVFVPQSWGHPPPAGQPTRGFVLLNCWRVQLRRRAGIFRSVEPYFNLWKNRGNLNTSVSVLWSHVWLIVR